MKEQSKRSILKSMKRVREGLEEFKKGPTSGMTIFEKVWFWIFSFTLFISNILISIVALTALLSLLHGDIRESVIDLLIRMLKML